MEACKSLPPCSLRHIYAMSCHSCKLLGLFDRKGHGWSNLMAKDLPSWTRYHTVIEALMFLQYWMRWMRLTSNSSKQWKGLLICWPTAIMKHMLVKLRSPPLRLFISVTAVAWSLPVLTCKIRARAEPTLYLSSHVAFAILPTQTFISSQYLMSQHDTRAV